jgi:hypothetical protein
MPLVDRLIGQTRFMVIIAVVASLVLAAALFLFGAVQAASIIAGTSVCSVTPSKPKRLPSPALKSQTSF